MESNALCYFGITFSLSPGLGLLIYFVITKKLKVIFLATLKALSHQKWNYYMGQERCRWLNGKTK